MFTENYNGIHRPIILKSVLLINSQLIIHMINICTKSLPSSADSRKSIAKFTHNLIPIPFSQNKKVVLFVNIIKKWILPGTSLKFVLIGEKRAFRYEYCMFD